MRKLKEDLGAQALDLPSQCHRPPTAPNYPDTGACCLLAGLVAVLDWRPNLRRRLLASADQPA